MAKTASSGGEAGLAERTKTGAGEEVVMGSNPAWSLDFLFLPPLQNFLGFFGKLVCRYLKR